MRRIIAGMLGLSPFVVSAMELVVSTEQSAPATPVAWFEDQWSEEPALNGVMDDVDLYGNYLEIKVDLEVLNNAEPFSAEILEPVPDKIEDFPSYEDVEKIIKNNEAYGRNFLMPALDVPYHQIVLHGAAFLDEERRSLLEQAKDEALESMMDTYRVKMAVKILQMDASDIERYSKPNYSVGIDRKDAAYKLENNEIWQAAFKEQLTGTEREQIAKGVGHQRERRSRAIASIILAEIDYWIGFDRSQRDKVLALAAGPLLELPELDFFAPPSPGSYRQIDLMQAMRLLQKSDEIKGVLNETQWKRFEKIDHSHIASNSHYSDNANFKPEDWPMPEVMTSVDAERIVSHVIWKASRGQLKQMVEQMEASQEHVARIAQPSVEVMAQLRTAGKGAAEELAVNWMQNIEQNVRRRLRGVAPDKVAESLKSVSIPRYNRHRSGNTSDPKRWTTALKNLLTDEEQEKLKLAEAANVAWRDQAIVELLMTNVDMVVRLEPDRREALRVKLTEILKEYRQDFTNMFSPGWHLSSYYSGIAVAMLSEDERAEYFDEKQLKDVEGQVIGQANEYSENLRQQHNNRVGNKAKGFLQKIFR